MALKITGGAFVHGPTPSNQNPRLKKAEERIMQVSSQLIALHDDLTGIKGAEGVRSRIADMDAQIHNLRATLFNLSHGR